MRAVYITEVSDRYADDIAIITKNYQRTMEILVEIYERTNKINCMLINEDLNM